MKRQSIRTFCPVKELINKNDNSTVDASVNIGVDQAVLSSRVIAGVCAGLAGFFLKYLFNKTFFSHKIV